MIVVLYLIAAGMMQTPVATALQTQTGTASGIVRTASGDPAAGVRVAAVAIPDSDAKPSEGAMLSLAQTDSAGQFKLENIVPGRYFIQAGLIDAPTYYPGVTTTTGATSILITAGATINGLNFAMSRGSLGVRVSGRVPLTSGRPVLIAIRGGTGPSITTTAQVRPDGTFEFQKVTPGSYTLMPSPANGLSPLPIVVTDHDVTV